MFYIYLQVAQCRTTAMETSLQAEGGFVAPPGPVQSKIVQDRLLLEKLTCPVCNLCLENSDLKDKRRSLKQHISRKVEAEHILWCDLFWPIHFVRNGYKLQPRQFTKEEVIDIVHKYFGLKVTPCFFARSSVNSKTLQLQH